MLMVPGAMALTRTSGASSLASAASEHDDAGFRDAVRDVTGPTEQSAHVGKIDDVAAILFQERRGGLRAEERCFEIYVERGIPGCFGGGGEFRVKKIGRVVDQDIQAAEFVTGFGDEPVDIGFFSEVGLDAQGAAAHFADFGGYFPGVGLGMVKMDDNIRALFGQVQRDGAAQAFGRAGNQGDLSSEFGSVRIGGRHRQIKN